jgi:hypothetical protein
MILRKEALRHRKAKTSPPRDHACTTTLMDPSVHRLGHSRAVGASYLRRDACGTIGD